MFACRCVPGRLAQQTHAHYLPIAMKISLTFIAVLAEVSMKSRLLSSAYACASYQHV